ncbi:MAG TPA: potassium-transporting ATPase subunit KdpC [Terriglobia bacterium]|nr:potassium-transporting ATPase subunit KdpC [Terriglobia bacterium]
MLRQLGPALRFTIFFTVLTGFVYPGVVTGLTQMFFPHRANGSLIVVNGQVVGSSLIGQNFAKPEYFQPRPSAAGNGYDATASAGSNYGPTNQKLIDRVKASIDQFRKDNPDYTGPIPADLVTASASGLDPDISPASAQAQVPRVAKARGIALEKVQQLVAQNTQGRTLGFLGEPRVNVLELNLALDRQFPLKSSASNR